jgi:hypothetical protein
MWISVIRCKDENKIWNNYVTRSMKNKMNIHRNTPKALWALSVQAWHWKLLSLNKAPIWGLRPDFYYCQLGVCWCGALSLRTGRVCRLQLLPAHSFSIFYCLRFETALLVASYDSQGYGGGIRPCLHTRFQRINPVWRRGRIPRTSQETHYISATKINWLILIRETIAV